MRTGVPTDFGADVPELAAMLKSIAHVCGSTALALSMHTHEVAIPAWRWRHQNVAAAEPLIRRVAAEQIILLSSGGSGSEDRAKSRRPREDIGLLPANVSPRTRRPEAALDR